MGFTNIIYFIIFNPVKANECSYEQLIRQFYTPL